MGAVKTFKWTVEIEVSENMVADGINLTDADIIRALGKRYPYTYESEFGATIIKAPSPESIAIAQGAYKRLGYVCQANGIEHVLVSVDGVTGKGSVQPLCGSKVPHGSLHTVGEAIGRRLRSCPECSKRDQR